MSVKVAFLVESFVTQLAEKWFFTSVNTHVGPQVGGTHKMFITNEALYKIAPTWKTTNMNNINSIDVIQHFEIKVNNSENTEQALIML